MLDSVRVLTVSVVLMCCVQTLSAAAPVVLFDEAHGQQFLADGTGPLDLKELAELYRDKGFNVVTRTAPLTRQALSAVDMLVISGPFRALGENELEIVLDFIEAGGGLAVMLHVAPPARTLLHRLEVDFSNGTLREASHVLDGNPVNFKVSRLVDHPVTSGLEGFSMYGAWALRATAAQTRILAETSRHGWVDLDHDNRLSQADAMQPFGVMVAGERGKGRYVVLGDDALFQNRFLDAANRRLAEKMLEWLVPHR